MIARVAEHCFWLQRYLERTENTARLLQVNLTFLLDASCPPGQRWWPVLLATGEEPGFISRIGAEPVDDSEQVQAYMVWEPRNPVSLMTSLCHARENARTIRETVSLEMWHSLNAFWLWLEGGAGRRMYERERHEFYERVKEFCQLFQGQYHTTMLYDRPYDFMRLGSLLERSDQTARLLDSMVSRVDAENSGDRATAAAAAWMAILRSCSAVESYAKRTQAPLSATTVIGFLLQEPAFPRAVRHCLERTRHFLERLHGEEADRPLRPRSLELLDELIRGLKDRSAGEILHIGLSAEVTRLHTGTALVSDAIRTEFFSSAPALAVEAN